jgi:tetratricopeptide (TPR) repeat protein
MTLDKTQKNSRVKEALGRIYDNHPTHFREYLRRYEQDPTSRVFAPLAESYRGLGRLDEAIQICLEGLEHHPDFHGGRVALARCYFDKKMFGEARKQLERVIQYSPENLMAQRLLGETFLAMGDRQSALHNLKMALILSSEDVALAEKVHALEQGTSPVVPETLPSDLPTHESAAEVPTIPPAAVPEIDPLLQKDEEDEAFHIQHVSTIFVEPTSARMKEITTETLANLYFAQGQFDRSLRILEKLEDKDSNPDIQRKINACRLKLGLSFQDIARNQKIELLRSILKRVRAIQQ